MVRDRPRPRSQRHPDVPRLAHPLRHPLRDAPRARLQLPPEFDVEDYRGRAEWQFGDIVGDARIERRARHRLVGRARLRRRAQRGRRRGVHDPVRVVGPARALDPAPGRPRGAARAVGAAAARRRGRARRARAHEGAPPTPAARGGAGRERRPRPTGRPGPSRRSASACCSRCSPTCSPPAARDATASSRRPSSSSASGSPPSRSRSTSRCSTSSTSAAAATRSTRELRGDEVHVDKELFGDTFRRPPRLTPLEARAIRLALEFVGPMIAAGAHSPLDRVRAKLEETFGAFELSQTPDAARRRGGGARRRS